MSSSRNGGLIDATDKAHQTGIEATVAVTAAFWAEWLSVVDPLEDEDANLWDILNIIRSGLRRFGSEPVLNLRIIVHPEVRPPQEVLLVVHQSQGDDGKPCITVMLPEEDQCADERRDAHDQ